MMFQQVSPNPGSLGELQASPLWVQLLLKLGSGGVSLHMSPVFVRVEAGCEWLTAPGQVYPCWVCRSQASTRPFRELSCDYSSLKFVDCPVTQENEFLHGGLGVPSLPYGHIYHPDAGLVEEVSINKKVFKDFERILQYYVDGEGEVEYTEDGEVCLPVGSPKKPIVTP